MSGWVQKPSFVCELQIWSGLVWSGPGLSRHLCLTLETETRVYECGGLSWNSWGLCHQMFYRRQAVGTIELTGPTVRCSGCPFMGQSTHESGALRLLCNIRSNSTAPDPHLHLQECHKALKDTHLQCLLPPCLSFGCPVYWLIFFFSSLLPCVQVAAEVLLWQVTYHLADDVQDVPWRSHSLIREVHVIAVVQDARWGSGGSHMEQIKGVFLWPTTMLTLQRPAGVKLLQKRLLTTVLHRASKWCEEIL